MGLTVNVTGRLIKVNAGKLSPVLACLKVDTKAWKTYREHGTVTDTERLGGENIKL